MTNPPETLAQLVARVLPTRYENLRMADRNTDVPYGTWQNVLGRGTIPTLETLERIADALDLPEQQVLSAARVSAAAREQAKPAPSVEEAKPLASRRRSARGSRSGTAPNRRRRP